MIDDVILTVGGVSISGWQAVRITRGIERIPSDIDISMTERYPDADEVTVSAGDTCLLTIGDDVVTTGYVDRVARAIDARQHPVAISGRGMCEDLVDCSAQISTFMFQNMSTAAIAAALAQPFGIVVLRAVERDRAPAGLSQRRRDAVRGDRSTVQAGQPPVLRERGGQPGVGAGLERGRNGRIPGGGAISSAPPTFRTSASASAAIASFRSARRCSPTLASCRWPSSRSATRW